MRLYRMELYKLWHKKGFVICGICIVLSQPLRADLKTGYMSASTFTVIILGMNFLALPLLIRMFFGGVGYFFTSCMPLFLIMTGSVYEAVEWGREAMMIPVIAVVLLLCVEEGYRVYRRM